MNKSSTPMIDHIPLFLNYCREIGLSEKTYENYKHYLNKFIFWLKKENKNTLLPHQLTSEDAQAYKVYLSQYKDEKGQSLKKVTQNYYLIALRALLGYFIAKDIVSLLPVKISLPGGFKREKIANFLNLGQIEAILLAPNLKTQKGLRDRAILETLIVTMIYDYFKTRGGKIIMEPSLNYGRADLGIYLKTNKSIYVEVDTVSLFKLWYNLATMKNVVFLIVPSENKLLEFKT